MQLRILVVDDDKLMRDILPDVLVSAYSVEPAACVETVGTPDEVARFLPPRSAGETLVVLCDYNLKAPRNGLDVLAEVERSRPDAVRVLFSGHTANEIRGIESARIHGFLEKPFQLIDLVEPLRSIIEAQRRGRPVVVAEDAARQRTEAVRALGGEEIVPALLRAATKGEGGRARVLYEEAQRRGQDEEAVREAARALVWQNRVLELVATGAPIAETLDVLARSIEEQAPGLLASVLLVDETGTRLRHGVAPSLPPAYNARVDGLSIAVGMGSCGTAASLKRVIIAEDVATDPYWADFRDVAQEFGLASCWSAPMVSPAGRLFGTFALYHVERRAPDERERQLLELGAGLARVAIESHLDRAALRASEERYRTLFRSIDEGFCILDVVSDGKGRPVDLRFVAVNPAFLHQTGLSADPTGRPVTEVQPGIEPKWFEIYERIARTGEPARFLEDSPAFGRWFDVFAFRMGDAPARVGVLFTDVTRRKLAEDEKERILARERTALAETAAARERLHAVILQAPVPIAILSGPHHTFELVNAGYEQLSGRASGELVGRSVRDAFPEIAPSFYDLLDGVYRSGERIVGREVPVTIRRGGVMQEIFVDFVYEPARGPGGAVDGIIVVGHEVTERVRARQGREADAAKRSPVPM